MTHGRDCEKCIVSCEYDSELKKYMQTISLYSIDTYVHIGKFFPKTFQYQGQIQKSLRIVLQKRLVNKPLVMSDKFAIGYE